MLLALLLPACGVGPDTVDSFQAGVRCGYVENEDSLVVNEMDPATCWIVRVGDGALLAHAGTAACEVERTGARCLILPPGEAYSVWQEADHLGMLAPCETDTHTTDCATVCD